MAVDENEVLDSEADSPDVQGDRRRHAPDSESSDAPVWLAWEGWRMRIPADWRPHKIECVKKRHHMLLGPADYAAAKIEWWWPKTHESERLPRDVPKRDEELTTDPADSTEDETFAEVAALAAAGEIEGAGKSFWFGYAPRANLVLKVVINQAVEAEAQETIRTVCLPSLSATDRDQAMLWSIFSASFVSPAGYELAAHRLEPGHMALRFVRGKDALVCRQIYPATLALSNRTPALWLRIRSFPERRTYEPMGKPVDWSVEVGGRRVNGLFQVAGKRFGAPFKRFGIHWTVSAVAHDEQMDRLLMAEFDSPTEPDETEVTEAIAAMNWAIDAQ